MKILLVVTKSELGGAQVFVLNLARALQARGEEVTVAGGPGDFLPAELAKSNLPFYRFRHLERSYNPLKIFRFASELRSYVEAGAFEVVHLNSSNALAGVFGLARLQPRPRIIFTVHGLSLLDPQHQANGIVKALFRAFFRLSWAKVSRLVFVSRLNYLEAKKQNLMKEGSVIANGLDFAPDYFLAREAARQALGERLGADLGDSFLYGSVGRLAYPKNYEFLINAHLELRKKQPNARLLLIGEGPERLKYEALIKSYRLEKEVFLVGALKAASRYLKAFDVFILPSVFEGLSLSLLEAKAAGVPVLASRVGGNEEAAGRANCFTLNDQVEFLEKISQIGSGEKPATEKVFSATEMAEKYLEEYRG